MTPSDLRKECEEVLRLHTESRLARLSAGRDEAVYEICVRAPLIAKRLLEAEGEITCSDKIIAEQNRVLDRLKCDAHGRCVPGAIEKIDKMESRCKKLDKIEQERAQSYKMNGGIEKAAIYLSDIQNIKVCRHADVVDVATAYLHTAKRLMVVEEQLECAAIWLARIKIASCCNACGTCLACEAKTGLDQVIAIGAHDEK